MAKPGRPGASKGNKKGPTKGTGGLGRKSLEGKGPTPKAEDRAWHVAGKRKAATRSANCCACMRRLCAAADDSSTSAAFCCVI